MTTIPQAAINAAAVAIERTLMRDPQPEHMTWLVADEELAVAALTAAAPHIAAAERERIRQAIANLAGEIDRMDDGRLDADDRLVAAETLRELASPGRLEELTEGGQP